MSSKSLSHTDDRGRARMVDVGGKPSEVRIARARGSIRLKQETLNLIEENEIKKGDVLTMAEVAGIQAAKQTAGLIPLCHTLLLSKVEVNAVLSEKGVVIESSVKSTGQTGVEMEALTAVSVALLTIYDMCKAVDDRMELGEIRLIEKTKTAVDGK